VLSNFFFVPTATELVMIVGIAVMFSLWLAVDIKSIGQKIFYTILFCSSGGLFQSFIFW